MWPIAFGGKVEEACQPFAPLIQQLATMNQYEGVDPAFGDQL
jgi:hypothetical protein